MEPQTFSWKNFFITLLRVGIGWHFFYEGLSKLLTPEWTATGFLADSTGFLNGFYHWMASSPALMNVIDLFNVYGLILIGLGLFFGVLTRYAACAGIVLLSLYYFAYPPFGMSLMMQSEGSLYIINELFVEAMALSIFIFLKEKGYGIDNLLRLFKSSTIKPSHPEGRREAIKNLVTLPAFGFLGWGAMVNQIGRASCRERV